jgi:peptidoglycan hydrolase-like protein with peptidoglycan-binding domain
MASRVISILSTLALVAAMVAPALAQSSGGSTGTGSAPATGSGGSTPSAPPAPSAKQPSTSTPTPGTGSSATGKAKPGAGMGQSGTTAPGSGSTMPSSTAGGATGAAKSGTGMNGGAGSEQVKSVQKALQDKGMDPGPIDGIMGPKTMAALKAFQKDQKLTESGRLDDQTREKLGVAR